MYLGFEDMLILQESLIRVEMLYEECCTRLFVVVKIVPSIRWGCLFFCADQWKTGLFTDQGDLNVLSKKIRPFANANFLPLSLRPILSSSLSSSIASCPLDCQQISLCISSLLLPPPPISFLTYDGEDIHHVVVFSMSLSTCYCCMFTASQVIPSIEALTVFIPMSLVRIP